MQHPSDHIFERTRSMALPWTVLAAAVLGWSAHANVAIAAPGTAPVKPMVIGGEDAYQGQFPYLVSIQRPGQDGMEHFCGGTLIGPAAVLTAAHCVVRYTQGEPDRDPADLSLVVDRAVLSDARTGKVRGVARWNGTYQIHVHPGWDASKGTGIDVAVVQLDASVADVPVMRLPTAGSDVLERPGTLLVTAGWGNMSGDGFLPATQLQWVQVPLLAPWECSFAYPGPDERFTFNARQQVCAGVTGRDACQGDSGGPLFARMPSGGPAVQVGVVSWGVGCALTGFPGVYARLSNPETHLFLSRFVRY